MFLRWSKVNDYRHVSDYSSQSNLRFLVNFFSSSYRPYDKKIFIHMLNLYDADFVYNDINNKDFYVGCSEWELDEEIDAPDDEEFQTYVNESNSCKISYDNYIEFAQNWLEMRNKQTPFAIIYRNDNDWIDCKGFDSKEEMELFVVTGLSH